VPTRQPIEVVLVDDHEVILDGARAMLAPFAARIVIRHAVKSVDEALEVIEVPGTDLVLTDARVRQRSGFDLVDALAERGIACPVVFWTAYDDEAYLFRALRQGARGYLLKQCSGADLVTMLERALEGEIVIDPSLAGRVALIAARLQQGEFWPGAHLGLSQRESEILELMVKGLSNRDIAASLFLGEETVKSHVSAIYRKLKVQSRTQAVAVALREVTFH
jgi:DNA-binding NarL/FixJ family response regulator